MNAPSNSDTDRLRSEGDLNFSPARQAWHDGIQDEASRELLRRDAVCFLHQALSTPCLQALDHCEGATIRDASGKTYLDFHGNSVHQVGFRHPKVIEAVKAQLDRMPFTTRRYTNEPAILLAEKLAARAPGDLNRVLFAPGGTTAVGMAMKLARAATGRFKTISMWEAFHGASLDVISLSGEAIFRQGMGPLLPGSEHVPPTDANHCVFGCEGSCNLRCADYLEYVLEREGDIGAVIAETMRATPLIPPPDYWKKIRAACDRTGTLLILDEISVGLGRTGKLFAVEHYGIVPDMIVIGKGLGGAVFPLAALIAREELNVAAEGALGHYTHEKNPAACAAGLAVIEIIEEEGLLENARQVGAYGVEELVKLKDTHELVGDVRGIGVQIGVELVRDRGTMERANDEAERVMYRCLELGLNFKLSMGNVIMLTPPLSVTRDEIDRAVEILDQALASIRVVESDRQ